MSSLRKLALVSLFSLGLLLLGAAAPAYSKTFCGDLYLGFSITGVEGLPPGIDVNSLLSQAKLPFRGKVYYQDGLMRLDVDLPNIQELAGSTDPKAITGYQVFSVLMDASGSEFTLIHNNMRQAYRFRLPAALLEQNPYKDPYRFITSKAFLTGLAESGLKYLGAKRLKARMFEGLKAGGIELQVKLDLPKDQHSQLKQLGIDLSRVIKLRFFFELESNIPLLYEMDSSIAGFTMQLVNIKLDRLPDVMFEVPSYYAIKDYSDEEVAETLLKLASEIQELADKMPSQMATLPKMQELPADKVGASPAPDGGAEQAAPEEEYRPAEAAPGSMNT